LRDLVEWVGRDAVRFFLVSRRADSEFVFDIDLALAKSEENPVYYVQYAHARVCSVLAQWGGDATQLTSCDLSALTEEREIALMKRLAEFPEIIDLAAREFAPHQVAFYLRELAGDFHGYYNSTRFLVPELARLTETEWAVFVDCDFLFLDDVAKLYELRDPSKAIQVVKHNYKSDGIKMDGCIQQSYNRKLWSSLMLFNVNHAAHDAMTHNEVNEWDGRELHQLKWVRDEDIGGLPDAWNWIPSHSKSLPSAVHYTEGMPFMPGYESEPYAHEWVRELAGMHHPSMKL
jgi:hypothetical protein